MPPKSKPKTDNTAMRELKSAIKAGQPGQLYLFHGEEAYLREYYLGELKKALLPDGMEQFNLHTARGKECSADWLEQAVDYLPMMSQRTLVLVTDYDLFGQNERERERLIALMSDLPDYCCLVFVYDLLPYKADARSRMANALKNHGAVVHFQRQEQGDLTDWISRRFRAAGHTIDTEDARYLIFLCGDLMTNLASEIGKIAAYAAAQRVTRADIDAVAVPQIEAIVFRMTDAIARKDFNKAAAVLSDLIQTQEPPLKILAAMGLYFRKLYTARLYLERGKTAGELAQLWKMSNSYQADKLMEAARQFSLVWCRHAVRRCSQSELEIKNAYGQEKELLVGLLMELSAGRKVIPC